MRELGQRDVAAAVERIGTDVDVRFAADPAGKLPDVAFEAARHGAEVEYVALRIEAADVRGPHVAHHRAPDGLVRSREEVAANDASRAVRTDQNARPHLAALGEHAQAAPVAANLQHLLVLAKLHAAVAGMTGQQRVELVAAHHRAEVAFCVLHRGTRDPRQGAMHAGMRHG